MIVIVSTLIGPFFGGILLAQNLARIGRRNKMIFPLLFGGLYNLITSRLISHFNLPVVYANPPLCLFGGIILITIIWNQYMGAGVHYRSRSLILPIVMVSGCPP